MSEQACLAVRSALEIWLTGDVRTLERLELLVRHWCEVYARDAHYTQQALLEATRLGERHAQQQDEANVKGDR